MDWKLFLDDERYPSDNSWVIARNYHDAVWYVTNYGLPRYISFDHDLAFDHYMPVIIGKPQEFTGYDFAKWFANYVMDNDLTLPEKFDFYVHSMNPVGAKNIRDYMSQWLHNYKIVNIS